MKNKKELCLFKLFIEYNDRVFHFGELIFQVSAPQNLYQYFLSIISKRNNSNENSSNLHPKIALFIPAIFLDKNPFSSIFYAFRINYFVSKWLVKWN